MRIQEEEKVGNQWIGSADSTGCRPCELGKCQCLLRKENPRERGRDGKGVQFGSNGNRYWEGKWRLR